MVFNIYQKFSKMFCQSNNVNKKREELSKFLRWVRRSWLTQNGWECEHFQILRLRSRCTLAYSDHHGNRWLPRRAWCETWRGDQTLPEHVRSFLFSSYFCLFLYFIPIYHAGVSGTVSCQKRGNGMKRWIFLRRRPSSTSSSTWSSFICSISSSWPSRLKQSMRHSKTEYNSCASTLLYFF